MLRSHKTLNSWETSARKLNPKKPLVSTTIPDVPWQSLIIHLFNLHNNNYLFVSDYNTRYFEVVKLTIIRRTVIDLMKKKSLHMAYNLRSKVTLTAVHLPEYFWQFTKEWNFQQNNLKSVSSQTNGHAKDSSKKSNYSLKKAKLTQIKSIFSAMFEYWKTLTGT